jgi:imidazolonepropionase-like amidohydrolase
MSQVLRFITVIFAITLIATFGRAQVTAIVGGTLIDGNGAAPLPGAVLIIRGERLISVGGPGTAIPADARRIDATGKYIIPGLMDANVHLVYGFSAGYYLRFQDRFPDIIREAAQVALKSGVTTVFDTWGPMAPLMQVRDEIKDGKLEGSRIFLGGNIVGLGGPFSPDFAGIPEGVGPAAIRRLNAMYERGAGHELIFLSPEQARLAIQKYLANDIDLLKIAVSAHKDGTILFSPEVLKIFVEEAHKRGLIAETHTTSIESLRMAVTAGADLMQHCNLTGGQLIPDDLLREIVQRKAACTLQIFPKRFLQHSPEEFGVFFQNQRRLIDAGAKTVIMTDGGLPYWDDTVIKDVFFAHPYPEIQRDIVGFFGQGHYAWLRGAVEAGLTPMQALQAVTRNVAAAYKKLADYGTLESGKVADLVMLEADPLADPAYYTKVQLVMKAGKVVDRNALPVKKVLLDENLNPPLTFDRSTPSIH